MIASRESRPLAMHFATEPNYSVTQATADLVAEYDPVSQTSLSLRSMSGSWCSMTSTGNQLTGQDADSREDD